MSNEQRLHRTHVRYDATSPSLPGGHPRALTMSSREGRAIKYCLQQSSVAAQMSTSALGNPRVATAVAMDRAGTESGGGGVPCHAHNTPCSGPHSQAHFRKCVGTASRTMGLGVHWVRETHTKPMTDHTTSVVDNGQHKWKALRMCRGLRGKGHTRKELYLVEVVHDAKQRHWCYAAYCQV